MEELNRNSEHNQYSEISRRSETIRRADYEDMHHLYFLLKEMCAESMGQITMQSSLEQLQIDGCSEHPAFEAWIAWEDNQPVGFYLITELYSAVLGKRTLYLEDLYVLPTHRQKGYGTRLFRSLCHKALRQAINVAWEVDREDFKLRHACSHAGAKDRPNKIGFYLDVDGLRYVLNHRGNVFKD
jgi:GNAT superfamily N-acetyltransferase